MIKMFKKQKAVLATFILSLVSLYGTISHAGQGLNVDGLIGVDWLSGGSSISSATSNVSYGARVGYHLTTNWELGAAFTTTSNSLNVGPYSTTTRTSLLMADFNYHLPDQWDALYFGIRLGLGFNSGSTNDPLFPDGTSSTRFAYGVVGGYDFKVSESFTIGPRIAYTVISQDIGNMGDFQAQAAFKYFFN